MTQEKANYPVTMMARVLEVSRSGFYAWSTRRDTVGKRRARQHDLDEQVRWFHDRSRGIYGAPRTADLHAVGIVFRQLNTCQKSAEIPATSASRLAV